MTYKQVKMSAIEARAERLGQLEMIDAYIIAADRWADDILYIQEDKWRELNSQWCENGKSAGILQQHSCQSCRGL